MCRHSNIGENIAASVMVPLTKETTTQNQERKVSFRKQVSIREIGHINDMPIADVFSTWYQYEDYQVMKKKALVDLKAQMKLQNKGLQHTKVTSTKCFRGLEGRTKEGRRTLHLLTKATRNAVLQEQMFQRQCGASVEDTGRLVAEKYALVAKKSIIYAHALGLQDELEAKFVYLCQVGDSLTTNKTLPPTTIRPDIDTKEAEGPKKWNHRPPFTVRV